MTGPKNDLSDCVLDCAVPITIRRAVSAPMEGGRKRAPKTKDIHTKATVVPVTGDKKQFATDGQWSEGAITIYAADCILSIATSDVGVADVICYQDAEYCVQQVRDWYALGGYYEAIAERITR